MSFDKLTRVELEDAGDFLIHNFPFSNSVDIVIQTGSGQNLASILDEEWNRVALQEMPHLPSEESLAKHQLEIIWGVTNNLRVLIFSGRYHYYEGYGRIPCILPIWAAADIGARHFLFCNAAAGIKEDLSPGSIMVFDDHVNNMGVSPLEGHQHLLKEPFVDMSTCYDEKMQSTFMASAEQMDIALQRGVYWANTGPQFETPAEIKMAKAMGADAVGMSTVLELTTAKALGAKAMAVSMIRNRASGIDDSGDTEIESDAANKELTGLIHHWLSNEAAHIF